MEKLIEVKNLTFSFPGEKEKALDNVSLAINKGDVYGIIGPSGCGKSTLMYALSGLIPHSISGKIKGSVEIQGKDTKEMTMADLSQITQILFQSPESQLFALNVEDEITFGLENLNYPWEEIKARLDSVLKELNIEDLRHRSIEELSSGQKQKIALASVLAMKPSALLFDEPTANLDPASINTLKKLIKQLSKKHTIVIVEHNLDLIEELCNRVFLMNKGKKVIEGDTKQVFTSQKFTKIMDPPEIAKTIRPKQKESKEPTILEIKNLHFSYSSKKVLHDIDLEIKKSDFLGILGLNGSGKSTLALNIIGLLHGKGKIIFDGEDISKIDVSKRAEKIGYVFQNPNYQLFEDNLDRELAFGPKNLSLDKKEIKTRVEKALDITGLIEQRKKDPHSLSIGQKRRVSIASVLSMNPEILIIDEPDTGLDSRTSSNLMDHIKSLNQKGKTIIVISHNLLLLNKYCTRIIGIDEGKIVPAEKILAKYIKQ